MKKIKVRVPATSANIGSGFDCMGLALTLYNEVVVAVGEKLEIITDSDVPANRNNLIYRSIESTMDYILEKKDKVCDFLEQYKLNKPNELPLRIVQTNNVPKASGLGSSATCIVLGIKVADALCGNVLSLDEQIYLATKMDGHPDNVLPAIVGGVTAGTLRNSQVMYTKTNEIKKFKVCVFIPSFPLETKKAREVLPTVYDRKDVVISIGSAVLTFAALMKEDAELLESAINDKIHEPYRKPLIKGFDDIIALSKSCGAIATYLSGAGPTIASFVDFGFDADKAYRCLSQIEGNYEMKILDFDNIGATVEIIE